ncbi:MAG: hypothetical protein MJ238_01665 [Bacilli bacterium]|nr:hypothetical protein [Bacilli bacterium]
MNKTKEKCILGLLSLLDEIKLSEIDVKMICKKGSVSRSAYYSNYFSFQELVDDLCQKLNNEKQDYLNSFDWKSLNIKQLLRYILSDQKSFYVKRINVFYNLFSGSKKLPVLIESLYRYSSYPFEHYFLNDIDAKSLYAAHDFIYSLLSKYLNGDIHISLDDCIEIVVLIAKPYLKSYM